MSAIKGAYRHRWRHSLRAVCLIKTLFTRLSSLNRGNVWTRFVIGLWLRSQMTSDTAGFDQMEITWLWPSACYFQITYLWLSVDSRGKIITNGHRTREHRNRHLSNGTSCNLLKSRVVTLAVICFSLSSGLAKVEQTAVKKCARSLNHEWLVRILCLI